MKTVRYIYPQYFYSVVAISLAHLCLKNQQTKLKRQRNEIKYIHITSCSIRTLWRIYIYICVYEYYSPLLSYFCPSFIAYAWICVLILNHEHVDVKWYESKVP